MSSRFWILRKHIISLDAHSLKHLPFYCWNCITLQLKHRDVDIVIRDEKEMEKLLKFLIYSLKTIDGIKDSALGVLVALN